MDQVDSVKEAFSLLFVENPGEFDFNNAIRLRAWESTFAT